VELLPQAAGKWIVLDDYSLRANEEFVKNDKLDDRDSDSDRVTHSNPWENAVFTDSGAASLFTTFLLAIRTHRSIQYQFVVNFNVSECPER
jgi:hypothetical protein